MASQGPLNPGTVADDADRGTTIWGSTGSAVSSNDIYSTNTLTAGAESHYILFTNFGFTIPAGSEIVGVKTHTELKASATGATIKVARLYIAGFQGEIKEPGNAISTSDEVYQSGVGTTDMWLLTAAELTVAAVNASTFGYGLTVTTPSTPLTVSCDVGQMTVYYLDPSDPGNNPPREPPGEPPAVSMLFAASRKLGSGNGPIILSY